MHLVWCGNLTINTYKGFLNCLFEKREKLHKSLGRPSRSDLVQLVMTILSVYENEIPNIVSGLSMYGYSSGDDDKTDYDGDMEKLTAKLANYKDNLELEEQKRKDALELARLKQGNINVSANASNHNEVNINITLEQIMDTISKIPESIMTDSDKNNLEDKVSGMDAAVKSGKKDKAKEKIMGILKFLADKSADAFIVMLPYLGQMAGLISKL